MLPCFPVDRTQSNMIVKFGFFGYYKKGEMWILWIL